MADSTLVSLLDELEQEARDLQQALGGSAAMDKRYAADSRVEISRIKDSIVDGFGSKAEFRLHLARERERANIWSMYAKAAADSLAPLGEAYEFDDPDALAGAITRLIARGGDASEYSAAITALQAVDAANGSDHSGYSLSQAVTVLGLAISNLSEMIDPPPMADTVMGQTPAQIENEVRVHLHTIEEESRTVERYGAGDRASKYKVEEARAEIERAKARIIQHVVNAHV